MAVIHQVMVAVFHVVQRELQQPRNLGGTQTTTSVDATAQSQSPTTSATASATTTMSSGSSGQQGGGGGGGPTSSPLLFFVALGFGVVFTNLWIIVGVKYCFRYNARNRALRHGEDPDPINLENMPTRPHRRRREKKLMTMEEVNERFPLTKYKNWVASRARDGLPTAGGVAASRPGSLRDVEAVIPSSPTGTKHTVDTRPETPPTSGEVATAPATDDVGGRFAGERKSLDATVTEKRLSQPAHEENRLEEVQTIASTIDVSKHAPATEAEEEDEDDHIHTAIPPELITNPGDSCAICIDTLEDDDDIRGLTCGHAFHAGCLDPWLTSRRACCPLCKADYYTPKPRPEGEVVDADRTGRRRANQTNMPQHPQSAWTGVRGRRLLWVGRHARNQQNGQSEYDQVRAARRARRDGNTSSNTASPEQEAESDGNTAARRWMPSLSNPFAGMRIPGRNRATPASQTSSTEASPSQLEAGIVG